MTLTPEWLAELRRKVGWKLSWLTGEELGELLDLLDKKDAEIERAWQEGYGYGHRQACPGRCSHGLARNPYGKAGR